MVTIKLLEWFAAAREASEGRFEALVREASDIIIVADDSDRLRYVSPAFDRILGYPPMRFGTRPATDIMNPDDLVALQARSDEVTGRSDGLHTEAPVATPRW